MCVHSDDCHVQAHILGTISTTYRCYIMEVSSLSEGIIGSYATVLLLDRPLARCFELSKNNYREVLALWSV